MNKVAFTEDELRQAALQVHEAMMAALTPFEEHEFSFEFHRKMSVLRRKMKLRHGIKSAAKSVAAIFLALLIGGGALLTFNADVRAAFFSWVREICENSAFYQFIGDEHADALPYIRPAWIPEGYVEVAAVGDDYRQTVIYQKDDDVSDTILFSYSRSYEHKYAKLQFDSGFSYKTVDINGYNADIYVPYDDMEEKSLVWFDDLNDIIYRIYYYGADDVILYMAESVYWKNR